MGKILTHLMAVLHYDLNSHELINFRIRDVLRFCNETGMMVLRMFGEIGWIRTNIRKIPLRVKEIYLGILHESWE